MQGEGTPLSHSALCEKQGTQSIFAVIFLCLLKYSQRSLSGNGPVRESEGISMASDMCIIEESTPTRSEQRSRTAAVKIMSDFPVR